MSKDVNVDFTITFAKGKIEELESIKAENGCNGLEKLLKLQTTNTTTNMHLFDANDRLKKYETVQEIIDDYFVTRLELYNKRKCHLIDVLTKELVLLSNKKRYILENLNGTIDLRRRSKQEIQSLLKERGFDVMEDDEDFKYLVKMPMDSVSQENVNRIEKDHSNKEMELSNTQSKTVQQMWLEELEVLRKEYVEFREDRERIMNALDDKAQDKKKKIKIVSSLKKKA